MKKNKKLIYIIIAISFIAVSAIGATYAYFLASGYSNKTSTVSVTADALDEVSCTATDLSMTVTGSDMKQGSSSATGTVAKTNTGTITCTSTKHTTGATKCTMDIIYTPTNTFTKSSNNTANNLELTLSGAGTTTSGVISKPLYVEKDMSKLTTTTTIIDDLEWIFDSNDTLTYTMTSKFYNYNYNQNDLAGKTYNGTISATNITCTGNSTTTNTVTFIANGGSVSQSTKQVATGYTYGNLPTPTKSGSSFKGWSELPTGYQEVEYITFAGAQQINTGFSFNPATDSLEVAFKASRIDQNGMILGSSSGTYMWLYYYQSGNRISYYSYSTNGQVSSSGLPRDLNYHYSEYNNKKAYMDGALIADWTSSSFGSPSYTFHIGSYGGSYYFYGNIYYLRLYRNGTPMMNLIPCYNSSTSKYGFCDLLNNDTFYGNTGSGNLTGGSNVYVTKDSIVYKPGAHTLYAVW